MMCCFVLSCRRRLLLLPPLISGMHRCRIFDTASNLIMIHAEGTVHNHFASHAYEGSGKEQIIMAGRQR